jgi:hypothetical protein
MTKRPVLDEKGGRKGHCLGCGKDLVMGSCPSDCPCGVAYEVENDHAVGCREERARVVAWLRETGLNPDAVSDIRYNVDARARGYLAVAIERGDHAR